jgi:hypothetical protein
MRLKEYKNMFLINFFRDLYNEIFNSHSPLNFDEDGDLINWAEIKIKSSPRNIGPHYEN